MTTLIVFSHLRWGFVYQRPQHLLSRLAKTFKVIVVEEPVHDAGPAHLECVPQGANLELLVPHTPVDAPGFHDDQLSVLQPLLASYLREHGIDDYLIWFYTPMALPLMTPLRPRAVVYDCMDELSAFKNAPRQLRQRETALLRTAHLVLTGGPALFASKVGLNPNVHCLPSSVDAAHFSPAGLDPHSAEAARALALQGHLAQPRLGFYGVIDERFDLGLLEQIARARPHWQLVMVGPVVKIDPAQLPSLSNIHWLGMQSYALLPHLMAGWDVCLMPFALNESTRFISPTKTLEYMAGGKPVVSTPVHDVVGLYGNVVRIAADAPQFIEACERALGEDAAERAVRVAAMTAAVRQSSWDAAAAKVLGLLQQALAPARSPALAPALADATLVATDAQDLRSAWPARQVASAAGPTGQGRSASKAVGG